MKRKSKYNSKDKSKQIHLRTKEITLWESRGELNKVIEFENFRDVPNIWKINAKKLSEQVLLDDIFKNEKVFEGFVEKLDYKINDKATLLTDIGGALVGLGLATELSDSTCLLPAIGAFTGYLFAEDIVSSIKKRKKRKLINKLKDTPVSDFKFIKGIFPDYNINELTSELQTSNIEEKLKTVISPSNKNSTEIQLNVKECKDRWIYLRPEEAKLSANIRLEYTIKLHTKDFGTFTFNDEETGDYHSVKPKDEDEIHTYTSRSIRGGNEHELTIALLKRDLSKLEGLSIPGFTFYIQSIAGRTCSLEKFKEDNLDYDYNSKKDCAKAREKYGPFIRDKNDIKRIGLRTSLWKYNEQEQEEDSNTTVFDILSEEIPEPKIKLREGQVHSFLDPANLNTALSELQSRGIGYAMFPPPNE